MPTNSSFPDKVPTFKYRIAISPFLSLSTNRPPLSSTSTLVILFVTHMIDLTSNDYPEKASPFIWTWDRHIHRITVAFSLMVAFLGFVFPREKRFKAILKKKINAFFVLRAWKSALHEEVELGVSFNSEKRKRQKGSGSSSSLADLCKWTLWKHH